jgi:hypothetical protein
VAARAGARAGARGHDLIAPQNVRTENLDNDYHLPKLLPRREYGWVESCQEGLKRVCTSLKELLTGCCRKKNVEVTAPKHITEFVMPEGATTANLLSLHELASLPLRVSQKVFYGRKY